MLWIVHWCYKKVSSSIRNAMNLSMENNIPQANEIVSAKEEATTPVPPNKDDDDVIDLTDKTDAVSDHLSKRTNAGESSSGVKPKRIKLSPVQRVLTVLPNAKLTYVESLVAKYPNQDEADAINAVIDDMLQGGYEKETTSSAAGATSDSYFGSTKWTTSQLYRTHALLLLQSQFPYLEEEGLSVLFESKQHHYYPTYKAVYDLTGHTVATYDHNGRLIGDTFTLECLAALTKKVKRNKLMRVREVPADQTECHFERMDTTLQRELEWMETKRIEADLGATKRRNKRNQAAIKAGTAVECGCCFGDFDIDHMRQCSEGHLFCIDCISRYVEQTVFGDGRSQLKCMHSSLSGSSSSSNSDGVCQGHFSDTTLRLSLRGKVFTHYCEAVARDALAAAALDSSRLKTCHYCQLQMELPADDRLVMCCPNCFKSTCTLCGEEAHVPLKCKDEHDDLHTKGRVSVEEAMTDARVRKCPRCKTPLIKVEGCDHVTCRCGASLCYRCGKNSNHNVCNARPDDRTAMWNAGMGALKKVEVAAKKEGLDIRDYQIDVNKLLE